MSQLIERTCHNHPDRRAIGACVITGKAICAECSTRYKGVNYSSQGLEILQQRRQASGQAGRFRHIMLQLSPVILCPVLLGNIFFSFWILVRSLMFISQRSG